MQRFNLIACGGTFDHLHKGHKEFLRFALSFSSKVILGLTSEAFVKNKERWENIEPYERRKSVLEDFLIREKARDRVEIVQIDDIFGPTLTPNLSIEAIVVSKESVKNAKIINEKRQKSGLTCISILVCPMIKGSDGRIISSTRIRNGEITRGGKPYLNPLWLTQTLILPENVRSKLQQPLGLLIKDLQTWVASQNFLDTSSMVAVGDVVTKSFNALSLKPKIAVVDFHVGRKKQFLNFGELGFLGKEKIIEVDNPAGCLTPLLFKAIFRIFHPLSSKERIVLVITGEEDLLVLPFLLLCPLGFAIFYGQPGGGVVKVDVSEENKQKAYDLIAQFTLK